MVTERQKANLRRGGAPASDESARRAREGKAALKVNDERLVRLAMEDPHKSYEELHGIMTRSILKLLRQEERSGGKPSRDVTDRLREYRQLTESLADYRRSQGADAEAEDFFRTLEDRMQTIAERMGCPHCGKSYDLDRPLEPVFVPSLEPG